METRRLGNSGLKVPVLAYGTGTFGGKNEFFKTWGSTDVKEATRLVDICLEHGVNFFDTANSYSNGASEEILGQAIKGRRGDLMVATKASIPLGPTRNDMGSSRQHLIRACEDSLRRLGTDYIDLYFMHIYDGTTPMEETLRALDDLTTAGKIRYIGCSNFSGWQVMKSLSISDKYGLNRYAAYQGYYSLANRDYEWELMPLMLDQGVGTMVWSPLGWGRLTGKIRRDQPMPEGRIKSGGAVGGPKIPNEHLYDIVDAIDQVAKECGKSISQVALNWLLQRPSVASIVVGARNEAQLRENLQAVGWNLTPSQVERLENATRVTPAYPYWHQMDFDIINPKPVKW